MSADTNTRFGFNSAQRFVPESHGSGGVLKPNSIGTPEHAGLIINGDHRTRIRARNLVQPPTRAEVAERIGDKFFVSPVEMSTTNLAARVVAGSDFQDFHHLRVVEAISNQFHTRGIRPPEIISERNTRPFDIPHGSYALGTLLDHVPTGTVGLWVTDPGVNSTPESPMYRDEIVIKTQADNYIVIPNNGIATYPILAQGLDAAWKIDSNFFLSGLNNGSSCQGEDLYAPGAAFVALDPANIERFAEPMDLSEVKTFPVEVGQEVDVDAFGQVRYALYLPSQVKAVDILKQSGELLTDVPVQSEGGFADLPPHQLTVYRSSGFKRHGAGLAEATINQNQAVDLVGNGSRIVRMKYGSGLGK